MPAVAEIRFTADVRNAQKNIQALNREVAQLGERLNTSQGASRQTSAGFNEISTETRQASTQVRQTSASFEMLETQMNEARRSALGLRDRMINLNAELAENRKRLLSADGAQKQVIETRNRAIRVNQSFISVEKQRNSQALAQFTQQRRELGGLSGGYREAARGAGFLSRAGSELAGTLGAIGITELGFSAVRFGSETVNAAVKVEGFQNSLTALYGDAQVAERVLNDLRDAAQLPGITFQGAVRGAVRLKTVSVEGERSLAVIREWGNAAALGGSSADDMGRSLVGLTQILSRGKVSQEELNQILEAVPLIGNSIREAFGSIDAETIRDTLDAAGQDVNDFVDILVNQLSMGARASADSTANAFSNLGNATFELQAAIGAGLTPVAADFARGLTEVISRITDFIDNTDSAKDAQIAFREALENSDTVLEQRGAVDARIQYLENYKQALFDAANELDKFDRRRQEIQSQVDDTNEQLETLRLIREGAISAAQLRQELGGLVDEYSELFAEEQKREEQAQLTHLAVSNVAIARLKGILEEKAELESEIDVYRNYIDIAEAAQKGTLAALEADETAKNRNIAVTAMLTTTTREAVNQQKELADTIISNEQAFAILTPTVEQLALAYQAAQTVADLLDNSMTDLEDTLLTGADPLKEYVAGLTLTSESADAALGSVNEVGEAANNADFSRASEGLYDFQDAVENTRRSHIDFRDVVDRETTPAVEDLTTALDASAQTSEQTKRAFDALDTVMDDVAETVADVRTEVDPTIQAFNDLSETLSDPNFFGGFLDLLGSVNDELADVAGSVSNLISAAARGDGIAFLASIPDLVHSLNALQNDPNLTTEARTTTAFDIIDRIQASDLSQGQQQELIQPIRDYIRELLVRSVLSVPEAISPALILQHESFARTQGLDFDFERDRGGLGLADTPFQTAFDLPEIDLSGVIAELTELERLGNSAKQRRGSGDTTTQTGTTGGTASGGRSTAQVSPTLRALTDVQSAYIQSLGFDPSIYGYDSRRNAFIKTAGGAGPTLIYDDSEAFDASRTPTTSTGSALGTPTTADPSQRFSFTADERAILVPYEQAVSTAQGAVDDLTEDSTVAEIAEAYQNLVFAQTNLKNISQGLIRAAADVGRITGTAATNAIKQLDIDLGGDIRTANNLLIRSLSDVGYQVIGGIMNIREAVDLTDIPSVIGRIPQQVEDAAPEAETPPDLRTRFILTDAQDTDLRPLRTEIREATEAISLLTDDSTPEEVTAAYTRLGTAEQAYLDKQLEFINAGVGIFADTALETARENATERFGINAFNANNRLVGNLDNLGFQLVTMFDETSGFLIGTALAIEQIPIPEVPETPDAPAALRDRHRFTEAQSGVLGLLEITANEAEDDLNRLRRDDTATPQQVTEAYQAFVAAEQAILTQELAFISDATDITEAARTAAEGASRGRFRAEIFDANEDLVGGLENLGFTLTDTITDWFGVLMGAALQISQIPPPEVPEAIDTTQPLSPAVFAQNRLNRARFEIRTAGTEQGFDTALTEAIAATNAYYDLEDTRLGELGDAEDVLRDKRADNQLRREQALFRYENLENPFREMRIRAEEDADEAILKSRMRLHDDISGLRDDALDAEMDRLEAEATAHERHLNRILDLELDFSRDLDDARRERLDDARDDQLDYARSVEDLQNRLARSQFDAVSFGELTPEQQAQLQESGAFRQREFELNLGATRDRQDRQGEFGVLRPGSAGYEFYRQQFEGGELTDENLIQRLFGTQGLDDFIDRDRGVEDAETRLTNALTTATDVYDTKITENTDALVVLNSTLADLGVIRIQEPSAAIGGAPIAEGVAAGVEMAMPDAVPPPDTAMLETMEAIVSPLESVGTVNISAGTVNVSGSVSGPAETLPVGVPVPVGEGDNRLFHFERTDAILQRAARQAASAQPRRDYLPDANQLRNSHDFAREVSSGVREGLGSQQPRRGGLSDQLEGGGDQEVTLRGQFILEYSDGSVSDLGDQMLRLKNQNRSF